MVEGGRLQICLEKSAHRFKSGSRVQFLKIEMKMDMVEINQICNRGQNFRTALALAALTGKAVHFTEFRSKFRKSGLMRQHLACATAVAEITGGTLEGAELKSQDLIFTPGRIRSGNYHFSIGCANSVIPIAQMLIPVL